MERGQRYIAARRGEVPAPSSGEVQSGWREATGARFLRLPIMSVMAVAFEKAAAEFLMPMADLHF